MNVLDANVLVVLRLLSWMVLESLFWSSGYPVLHSDFHQTPVRPSSSLPTGGQQLAQSHKGVLKTIIKELIDAPMQIEELAN